MTTGLDVEAVLRDHPYELEHRSGRICLCGFIPTVDPETLATQQDYHTAHVAAVLRVEIESALGDAWDEGLDAGLREPNPSESLELPPNPYRASLAATEGDSRG